MLNASQLVSIGFRYVLDELELLTPMGAELARHPHYYKPDESELLHKEQSNLKILMAAVNGNTAGINALMRVLMPVKNIKRSVERCGSAVLTEVELFELKRFLLQLGYISKAYNELGVDLSCVEIHDIPDALDIIDPDGTRAPSFYVSDRHSPKLAGIRAERKAVDERLRILSVTGGDPDETEKLRLRRTVLAAEEEGENGRLRAEISDKLAEYRDEMLVVMDSVARLDYTLAKARLAVKYGAAIPVVGSEDFSMQNMSNPCFSATLEAKGRKFVPVSLTLASGSTVITGANMGGKSMAIKTLALNCMLAMCGFAVFTESSRMPMLDDIYLLSEDREDSEAGLSSFGGEIKAFDAMLRETERMKAPLVLLDEFARGTNPHEGAALVRAAAKLFNNRNTAFAVIATHFDGVSKLGRLHYRVAGLSNVSVDTLLAELRSGADALAEHMDYGLYPVAPTEEPPRDAVTICRALGVKQEFAELIER